MAVEPFAPSEGQGLAREAEADHALRAGDQSVHLGERGEKER